MKDILLESFNNIVSCVITFFYPRKLNDMSYKNRVRAFMNGKTIFKVYVDDECRVMYASSLTQAKSKFTGCKVTYLIE